jgi:hypothetical protein
VPLPRPELGLVINYSYLWRHQHERGIEEGDKDRPCVIIAVAPPIDGVITVAVAPITHRQPQSEIEAVEMPSTTKMRLGMDHLRSWIVCVEVNRFAFPGPDLRPVPGRQSSEYAYGFIPPNLLRKVQIGTELNARLRRLRTTFRES